MTPKELARLEPLDYEIVEEEDGDFAVWTPDSNGGVIGLGKTKQEAVHNAITSLGMTIVKLVDEDLKS